MACVRSPSQRLELSAPLNAEYDGADLLAACRGVTAEDGIRILRDGLTMFAGRIAVVSSFGAQSAVLLAYVAEIAPSTPIFFIDTGKLFPQTLEYRQALADQLGLLDVRDLRPSQAAVQVNDPAGALHRTDPDACCNLRKVVPLQQALAPFAAWVNGRRRTQSASRAGMQMLEASDGRIKINPLAAWSDAQIEAEMTRRRLPRHPLIPYGYSSIGCAPCTQPAAKGADPRSGRWAGSVKTECGIHRAAPVANGSVARQG